MAEYFRYRRQPLKGLYQLYAIVSIVVSLPVWAVLAAIPATRQRRSWPMSRCILVRIFQRANAMCYNTDFTMFDVDTEKNARSADALGFVWVDPIPQNLVRGEIAEAANVNGIAPARISGYWYGAKSADGKHGQVAAPGEKVVYALHCGGFVMESGWPKGSSAPIYTGILERCSPLGITRLFSADYRLAVGPPFGSANAFPAALIDAVSGYRYLIEDLGFAPADIVLLGDSSGGALAVSFLRYIIAEQIFPAPAAALLLSPSVDLGYTHDSDGPGSSVRRNASTDFTWTVFQSGYTRRALVGALPQEAAAGAWISPASLSITQPEGLFKGFPRTLIISGGAEHTVDPMVTLYQRIKKDVGEERVKYHEYPEASHDFVAFSWCEPERTQALTEIRDWLAKA